MTIIEATKKAIKQNCGIARPFQGQVLEYFVPTNSSGCYLMIGVQDEQKYPRWNPTADDILSNDWVLWK